MAIKYGLAFVAGLALGCVAALIISDLSLPDRVRKAETVAEDARMESLDARVKLKSLDRKIADKDRLLDSTSRGSRKLSGDNIALSGICVGLLDVLGWQVDDEGRPQYSGETRTGDEAARLTPKQEADIFSLIKTLWPTK